MSRTRTFWLSMHVPYACRHSGACCSSGWAIPLERGRVSAIRAWRRDESWLRRADSAPDDVAGVLAVSSNGHCVFHRDGCEIQHALGPGAMPSACQHFPREVLIDTRGVFVTLSHYCPTAADLLFRHAGAAEIVEGPPALPNADPEGLDARDVLPPLLTDGVLMDLDGYAAWEAHMVRVLTQDDGQYAESAVATLEADLANLQRWRPGGRSLVAEVAALSRRSATPDPARRPPTPPRDVRAHVAVAGVADETVIRRYLAARAFASWMAYQGGGVGAVLRSLRLALSVLREQNRLLPLKEAIRQTDLQLVHLMPRDELARRCA